MPISGLEHQAILTLHRLVLDAAIEHYAVWANAARRLPDTPAGRELADHQLEVVEAAYDASLALGELKDYLTSIRLPWDTAQDGAEDHQQHQGEPEHQPVPLGPVVALP